MESTKPYIYNQQGTGLVIRSPAGDIEELADISLACRHAISTANLGLKGYIWDVKYHHHNSVIKTVFVKKAAMTDPIKFEAAIDSQHGLPFAMNLGPYRYCIIKHYPLFLYFNIQKVLEQVCQ